MKVYITKQRTAEEKWVIEKIKLNPKVFYSYANKHRTAVSPIGPLVDNEGTLHHDAKAMAEILQKQYCSVFSDPADIDTRELNEISPQHSITDIAFTAADIIAAINEIKNNSAVGPDRFPVCVLKECRHYLASPLANLWRISLDSGYIPKHLRTHGFQKGEQVSCG